MGSGLADYHTHTVFCHHAEGTVSEYVEAARRRGLDEICFTDHIPAPDGYDPANRMTGELFPDYHALVYAFRAAQQPVVRFGVEADYYEGCQSYLPDFLGRYDFDLVLGSVHYIRDWGFDNPAERSIWDSVDVTATWREYFELVGRLADTRLFDILAHADLTKKFGHRPAAEAIADMVGPAFDKVAAAGMSVELNTGGLRKPIQEIYPSLQILKLARERDIPITFGSDAHRPEDVGADFDAALSLARAAGYTHCARYQRRQRSIISLPG